MGMIAGIVFVFIGLFMAIPSTGLFGISWTLMADGITSFHAYNFFSDKGVESWGSGRKDRLYRGICKITYAA